MTEGLWHALLASLLALLFSLAVTGRYKFYPAFTCYVGVTVAAMLGGFSRLTIGPWTVAELVLMVARAAAVVEVILHLTSGMWWGKERRRVDAALLAVPCFLLLAWPAHSIPAQLRHFQTVVAVCLVLTLLVLHRIRSSPESRHHAWIFFALMANQALDLWMWEWWPEIGRETVLALNYAGATVCAVVWVGLLVKPKIPHRVAA